MSGRLVVAALLLAVWSSACSHEVSPVKVQDLPLAAPALAHPLHIYVSNQSYALSSIEVDVYIDDTHIITGTFKVGSQHSWVEFDFTIDEGTHTLRATLDGEVLLEQEFTIEAERWGVLNFWYYPDGQDYPEPMPKQFSWNLLEQAPMFE